MSINYPYPVKNWKDPEQYLKARISVGYEVPTKFDLKYWRWEFLRRNSGYQKILDSYEIYKDNPSHIIQGNVLDYGSYLYLDPRYDLNYQFLPALCELHILPSFQKIADIQAKHPKYTDEAALTSLLMNIEAVQQKGGVFISLDLNLPIEIQFEKIKQLLKRNNLISDSTPIKQIRPSEWTIYLRLLDAKASGASIDDIASTIYPHEVNDYSYGNSTTKKIEKALIRAEYLRDNFGSGGKLLDKKISGYG